MPRNGVRWRRLRSARNVHGSWHDPSCFATLILVAVACGVVWLVASRLNLEADVAITAHRGASIAAPENTLAAFRAAMEAGATYIELDVQRTRDGQIAVLHDGDLMRMGDDPRKLGELTVTELANIDIGRKYATRLSPASTPSPRGRDRSRARPDEDQRRAQVQRTGSRARAGRGGSVTA